MNRIDIKLITQQQDAYIIVDDDDLDRVIEQLESNEGCTIQASQYGEKFLEVHVKNAQVQAFIVERDVKVERNTDD